LNLEEKYIQKIESMINEKYNKIIPIFNNTYSKINRAIYNVVSSKINISESEIKREIKRETLKIHNTQEIIKSRIRKGNRNITNSINNYFQKMLSFINNTVSGQTFIQHNLTNDYIHKIYFKEEISIKYILIFYAPFVLYFMYACYKKYFYTKKKKTILPLHFPKSVQQNSGHAKNIKWKKKIKDLESNLNVLMELNKNEKNK
jgi:hypothetical protein